MFLQVFALFFGNLDPVLAVELLNVTTVYIDAKFVVEFLRNFFCQSIFMLFDILVLQQPCLHVLDELFLIIAMDGDFLFDFILLKIFARYALSLNPKQFLFHFAVVENIECSILHI